MTGQRRGKKRRHGTRLLFPAVVSGYRTAKKQQSLYEEKIKKFRGEGYSGKKAKELAARWVAMPGHSEHQLGLAVDMNGAVYDLYLRLQENSYRYGFIFRYPGEKKRSRERQRRSGTIAMWGRRPRAGCMSRAFVWRSIWSKKNRP